MHRYEHKGYWIELFIANDDAEDWENPFYYEVYIELPHGKGVTMLDNKYVTVQEARQGAEKYIDMLEAFPESEVNFSYDEHEEFVFNQPEAWGSSIIDY